MSQELQAKINERNDQIEMLKAQLNHKSIDKKETKRITKEIANLEKMNKKAAFWGGVSTKLETGGAQLQQTGKSMQKAGLHTTAAVWTPVIYAGYRVAKSVKGKSPESDLVSLVKECEQAHAEGKITEEQMKEYIIDFTNNYYRK
ncbi:hypothetical protein HU147_18565 [Planomicrobium chinense]|uniref:hypothetical protein n=1 Tax=Planococcus chinensis TaxID=272917 RepID=UPI001CC68150|nr:hypothetical protein [Planococcus chinensis]MBZ5203210.1 hypothetical protein [Planococcus chinensis]